MRSHKWVFAVTLAIAVFVLVPPAFASTIRGQGLTASKLSKSHKMPTGKRSTMTFTLRASAGSKILAYAVSTTKFYERGPNDSVYHRTSRSEAYSVFRTWGGGGYFPAKFVYKRYRRKGETYRVLSKAYFFMAGE